MKSKTLVLAIVFILLSLSTLSQTISTPTWWDTSWNYRVGVEVNTTDYSRFNWPVEVDFNFTDILLQKGSSGTFDINSTRVVEHNSTGGVMYELTSQFDTLAGYDAASNAVGTIIFLLNGSNPQNTKRYFYIYFDIEENGAKSHASYSSILNYSWDGEEFSVNNTNFQWLVDTIRAENTSGFYSARGSGNTIFKTVSTASKTKEYTEFQNGTTRLMFDFRNNATFTAGPLRLTVEQRGEEAYWNDPDNKTNEGFMVKKYIFYENISWMRIVTNFTNIVGQSINRSSTLAGATSFNELNSTEVFWPGGFPPLSLWGNNTNPTSWYGASKSGGAGIGIVHENQAGTSNYYIAYNSSANRMGASLNETAIPAGQSILQVSVIHFNATDYNEPMIRDFRDRIASAPNHTILSPDELLFEIAASSNYSVYNRGEAALIFGNVTLDDYGQVSSVNATLDMGTPATGDDQTIILYDDGNSAHGDATAGDKIFSNYFNITASNQTGTWNFTVYAYDAADDLLNTNSTTFNVTDEYTVVTFVENPLGISGRLINATINVENIRNDTYIPGAVLKCTYGAGQLTNITDYGNGTYRLNFTSPSITGAYTLNCTASKLNNTGWGTDEFYTEDATTDMNITFSPPYANISNTTWYVPENFTFTINSTNTGNASARYTNITLYLPSVASGATFAECGLVGIGASCIKSFNITVANQTAPGIYQINTTTTWENPDTTKTESNATFNISVLSNPKIEVPDNIVSGMVADGETQEVGFFNVTSFGNTNASNITFFVSGLPASFIVNFTPANISSLAPNNTNIVAVNVSVPVGQAPATYNGSINASSAGGGWDNLTLQIIVPPNTTMLSSTNPLYSNISDITWYASENFTFTVNSTNTGNSSAKYANITLYLPSVASGPTFHECGNISRLSLCLKSFNITVASQTTPGTYKINVTTAWMNPDLTSGEVNTTFNIDVLSNPEIEVPQTNITGIVGDGETQEVGFFNVTSFGNTNASNITFSVSGLPASFIVNFTPANISTIAQNNTNLVAVNVTVPQTYEAGNYTGTVNVSAANDGYDTFVLNISVPENKSWSRTPPFCIGVEVNDEGPVCTITVNNTGNAPINITISPSGANYTYLNETNFTLQSAEARYVLVSYNVTIPGKGNYNATYTISTPTPNTMPENMTVDISIVPYIEPTMSSSLSSVSFGQNKSVELNVNVTDQSTSGINWTIANITAPDGTIFTSGNMTFNGTIGNITVWMATFPDNFSPANTSLNISPTTNQRGQYNISIRSADNTGALGTTTSQFKVHWNLTISLNTTAAKYPEGDAQCTDGTIDYVAYDLWNSADINLNASIEIRKDNEFWFENTNYEVSINERIRQLFPICVSDAGIYTVISETVFYDDISNETVTVQKNATFEVYSVPITLDIVNPSFEDTRIAFRVWVKDIFGAYIAPDEMDFSLYRDVFLSNNSVLSVLDTAFNFSDSCVVREDTALGPKYIVSLSGISTSDPYWIHINATYGGRIGFAENSFNPGVRTWYDVMLSLKQHERYLGEYLDFDIIVENKAGAGQDVFVEYWVSNAGTEEKSWYSASMHAYVGKESTIYLPLKAYILPAQPYGNYWLHAKVTPTNDTSSGFSWMAHDTFSVVQRPVEKPYVPETPTAAVVADAGAAAGREDLRIISIVRYPKNVSTVRGWTDISTIEIKNTGDLPVNNISLTLTGVPQTWYTLRPDTAQDLSSGNSTAFLFEFNIPGNADIGTYDLVFTAKGNEASDEKLSQLTIFQSVEEMLLAEIRALKVRLQALQEEMDFAGTAGKNISQVIPVLERAENEISLAEAKVANASYEEAHNHILLTKNLLDRAEVLLKAARYIDIVPTKIIPPWLIVIIILLAVLAAFAFIWTFRLKRRMKLFFRTPATMMRAVHLFKKEKEARQEFLAEREKLVRMQNLLEREVKDGTITESAYKELSKRTADKLKDLDKK